MNYVTNNKFVNYIYTSIAGLYIASVLYTIYGLFTQGASPTAISVGVLYASMFISTFWSISFLVNQFVKKGTTEDTAKSYKYGA